MSRKRRYDGDHDGGRKYARKHAADTPPTTRARASDSILLLRTEATRHRRQVPDAEPGPGVPTVKLTRAALLAGLSGPADMDFGNEAIEPVAPWLSQSLLQRPDS